MATWKCLATVRLADLRFEDGILVGMMFYVVCPSFFILLLGEINNYELEAEPFRPFEDLSTSFNILVGWWTVLCFHATRSARRADIVARPTDASYIDLFLFGGLYVCLTGIGFVLSGRAEGGHWQHTLGQNLGESTALILILNFANVYRTAIFGYLLFAFTRGRISRNALIVVGLLVVAFDFLLTFNRITAVYFIICVLWIYRRYFWALCLSFLALSPIVGYLSTVWSVFRAFALRDGYNLNGLISAFEISMSISGSKEQPIDRLLNSLFESSSLVVLKYIVKHIDESFPPLWGSTFVGRSFTFLVPSTWWPDKPRVFGTILGQYIQSTQGLALNSTLFGEALANFYYFWPLALFLMLLLVAEIFRSLSRAFRAAGFLGFFIAVALWRFDMAFAFISLFAISVFAILRAIIRGSFVRPTRNARSYS
ncbi:hypothetical protein UNPA324_30860 [Bradyrhizobium sp. UNPA324]|nr:hypothetical protein UNPA324_30860 [Bradyrhizobium sp. UNPA324]